MPQNFRAFTAHSQVGLLNVLLTPIRVRLGTALTKNQATPWGFEGTAIWDTGATRSCISERVVQALSLKPISMATVHAAGNSFDAPVFKIDFMLLNNVAVQDIDATQARNLVGCDVLVGMDVITLGDLAVTNAERTTVFSFRFPPADKHIDYVKDAEKQGTVQHTGLPNRQNMIKKLKRKGFLR